MTINPFLGGSKVQFTDHLGGTVRGCAGYPPRLQWWPMSCQIDEINGFTRQLGRANCYKRLTNPVPENGFKDRFVTFYVYRRNQRDEEIHNLLTAQT
ncbi:hypothetical protein Y032_0005g2403 [Ancylostoma ceylanicum]|uniref:Uncharacterized protein n=1 Tax=Ancylostoma ceylanicum TaxID=53326 RepID=A0A016VR45_9BILA|nr:hypothetical protein Y032_0005g2403 [Ancylostoma ceylanicum]